MSIVYKGKKDDFKAIIEAEYPGVDCEDNGTKLVYRFKNGEILNWWQSSGTVNIQGSANDIFKEAIERLLSTPSSIINKDLQIFIVYGHDSDALEQLEHILLKLDLKPFIMKNEPSNSQTIIEVLEQFTSKQNSAFGIVLMTPDDKGSARDVASIDLKPRARQNVILEMGMLMAALGRSKVAILQKGTLERPSDIEGMLRFEFNTHVKEIAGKLIQSMKQAGVKIDSDKALEYMVS